MHGFIKEKRVNSPNCKEKKFQITKVLYKDPVVLFCEQTQKSWITAEIISVDCVMGYKLDGQVHGLPKIYSGYSHLE